MLSDSDAEDRCQCKCPDIFIDIGNTILANSLNFPNIFKKKSNFQILRNDDPKMFQLGKPWRMRSLLGAPPVQLSRCLCGEKVMFRGTKWTGWNLGIGNNMWQHHETLGTPNCLEFSVFKNEILVPNTIAFGPWVFLLY